MYENNPHTITAVQIAELLPRLSWLDELPLVPLRLAQIGKHNAVAADLSGVPFADYLACDNLYTGYLQTQQNDLLREMAAILYKSCDITLTDEEAISSPRSKPITNVVSAICLHRHKTAATC